MTAATTTAATMIGATTIAATTKDGAFPINGTVATTRTVMVTISLAESEPVASTIKKRRAGIQVGVPIRPHRSCQWRHRHHQYSPALGTRMTKTTRCRI